MSTAPAIERAVPAEPGSVRRRADAIVVAAVVLGVLAAAVRLALVLHGGGLAGVGNYDDGVYYGAADAFVHGRMPYRDFLFLQPPGILVLLAPFAWIGAHTWDLRGFELARLAGYAAAGVTTAFVVLALRRCGLVAAVVAGLLYALIEPAVFTSRSALLEPVGAFSTAAVLAVLGNRAPVSARRDRALMAACGVLLAVAIAVKIWAVVPAVILLAAARRRRPGWLLGGAVVGGLLLFGPFVAVDPAGAWRQIVLDQLGRPRFLANPIDRLAVVVQAPPITGGAREAVTIAALVAVAAFAVLSWRWPIARLATVLLVASAALLLATPSFFDHYAALVTPFLAVVVGAGVQRVAGGVRSIARRRMLAVGAGLATAAWCLAGWPGTGALYMLHPPMSAAVVRHVGHLPGCVVSDDPTLLVLTGTLSRDLAHGCPFWPDLTGWELDADRVPPGASTRPVDNAAFQQRMADYLRSGDAALLGRQRHRLTAATLRALAPLERWQHGRYLIGR